MSESVFLVTQERRGNEVVKHEHIIHVCGDCPERTGGEYCIRKSRFINLSELYKHCPLIR